MRPYATSVWGLKLLVYEALRSVEPKSHEALKGEAKWGGGDDVKPAY
jgi:hypothetical protein